MSSGENRSKASWTDAQRNMHRQSSLQRGSLRSFKGMSNAGDPSSGSDGGYESPSQHTDENQKQQPLVSSGSGRVASRMPFTAALPLSSVFMGTASKQTASASSGATAAGEPGCGINGVNSEDFDNMASDMRRVFGAWLRSAQISLEHSRQSVALERKRIAEEREMMVKEFERSREAELQKIYAERVRTELETQAVLKQIELEREETRKKLKDERRKFDEEKIQHIRQLNLEQHRLAKEASDLDKERRRIIDTTIAAESQVEINVGGQIFETSRHTVTQFPGSFLEALFSGRHKLGRDKGGRIFIDRDSDAFRMILNYLRNPEIPPTPKDLYESDILAREAEFYGVKFMPFPLIMAIGGHNGLEYLRSTEVLDISRRTWRSCAKLETPRAYFGAAAVANRTYACGGQNVDYRALCDVEIYDVLRDHWCGGPTMILPRRNLVSCVLGNRIYSIGGYDGVKILPSVEALDVRMKNWVEIAPLKEPRASPMVAVLDEKIYIMGGSRGERVRSVEVFDPRLATNVWESFNQDMLEVRSSGAGGCLMESIFALGGVDGKQRVHESLEILNPDTGEWSFRKSMPYPRMDLAAVVVENSIVVAGGQWSLSPSSLDTKDGAVSPQMGSTKPQGAASGSAVSDAVDFYRADSNEWQSGPPLLEPRFAHRLVLASI